MKVVILAGGIGSRISEESVVRPKPLIEIGGMPIIWHIMKIYSSYGFKDFVICCGYKGYLIKEFFSNYFLHSSDLTIDLENDKIIYHQKRKEPWKITLVDTGDNTSTGGRMNTIAEYAVKVELRFRNALIERHDSFFAQLKDDRGDVPGWVLVVLMTTGLVTAIWTIAAPRLTAILKDSLDSMNGIR